MPGKVRLRFKVPVVRQVIVDKQVAQKSKVLLRLATRAWLKAAAETIPVYTGTAKGTYKPLGRFLKVAVPIGAVKSDRKQKRVGGQIHPLGPDKGDFYSDFELKDTHPQYRFIFDQTLPWAVWNILQPGPPQLIQKTPWNSHKIGRKAFFEVIRSEGPKRLRAAYRASLGFKEINA